jgi:hypothetical protein
VDFTSADPNIAAVAPGSDSSYQYQTTASGNQVGSTTITGSVYLTGPTLACTDTVDVNIINPGPWWQVVDGSVHSFSDIISTIPSTCAGACVPSLFTGISGLASYLGTLDIGSGSLSEDGSDWQAETVYSATQTGYAYFKRLLEDDPAGIGVWASGGLPAEAGVYLIEDNATTGGDWSIADGEKFVLLADGDVTVSGNIEVATGGFLAIIASGDINIDPSVTNIEGVFVADGTISTGLSNQQLTGEGIFAGWEGINLQRDLDDDSQTPAELFIYRPDLQLNAYDYLLWLGIEWKEVAP